MGAARPASCRALASSGAERLFKFAWASWPWASARAGGHARRRPSPQTRPHPTLEHEQGGSDRLSGFPCKLRLQLAAGSVGLKDGSRGLGSACLKADTASIRNRMYFSISAWSSERSLCIFFRADSPCPSTATRHNVDANTDCGLSRRMRKSRRIQHITRPSADATYRQNPTGFGEARDGMARRADLALELEQLVVLRAHVL